MGPHTNLPKHLKGVAREHPNWCHKCYMVVVPEPTAEEKEATEAAEAAAAAAKTQSELVATAIEAAKSEDAALEFLRGLRERLFDNQLVREHAAAAYRVMHPPITDSEHLVHAALDRMRTNDGDFVRGEEYVEIDYGWFETYQTWDGVTLFDGVDLGEVCPGCSERLMGNPGWRCGHRGRSGSCNLVFCTWQCAQKHPAAHGDRDSRCAHFPTLRESKKEPKKEPKDDLEQAIIELTRQLNAAADAGIRVAHNGSSAALSTALARVYGD